MNWEAQAPNEEPMNPKLVVIKQERCLLAIIGLELHITKGTSSSVAQGSGDTVIQNMLICYDHSAHWHISFLITDLYSWM